MFILNHENYLLNSKVSSSECHLTLFVNCPQDLPMSGIGFMDSNSLKKSMKRNCIGQHITAYQETKGFQMLMQDNVEHLNNISSRNLQMIESYYRVWYAL